MTRIDENCDARRAEEQRAAEKKHQKRSEKQAEQFAKLLNSGRRQATEQSRQQAARDNSTANTRNRQSALAGKRLAAHSALLARRGIQSNAFAERLHREGNVQLNRGYEDRSTRQHALGDEREARRVDRAAERKEEALLKRQADKLAPVSRDEQQNGRGDGFGGHGDREGRSRKAHDVTFGAPGRSEGVGSAGGQPSATASQGAGGATPPPQMLQMVQEIVKHVMAGVDSKGLGVMHIELKENVLAGAQLTIKAEREGLSLRIRTHDNSVARLFSSGQTAHELQQALQTKGIELRALEVNGDKVVRS